MFRAHSLLWHYLWAAPNLLLGVLAILMWWRGDHKCHPAFWIYALFEAIQWAILYPIDLIPSVAPKTFWRAYWSILLVEALVTFALVSEIFANVLGRYPALARLAKLLIRWIGPVLVMVAAATAAFAPIDNPYWLIPASHILQQTVSMIECGLIVFLFMFTAYFGLPWSRVAFGIALGLGISACVHLGTWAVMANGGLVSQRDVLDLVNMATFHICVLIWFYYVLVPEKNARKSAVQLPEHNLELWNRELERLLQQ
jgi:hypothetical protein